MPDPNIPETQSATEPDESFDAILSHFEQSHSRKSEAGKGREGTVITVSSDSVLLDIGFKTEGILPLTAFQRAGGNQEIKPGDKFLVSSSALERCQRQNA